MKSSLLQALSIFILAVPAATQAGETTNGGYTGCVSEAYYDQMMQAVALGRKGGKVGGKARAAKLSADERSAIARKAAKARWNAD